MAGAKVAKSALEALRAALARSVEPRQAYDIVPARPPEPSAPPSQGTSTDPIPEAPPRPLPEARKASSLEDLLNSPMSRRGFLRAAGAQAAQRMMPSMPSPLSTVGDIARSVAAKKPFSLDDVLPGIVARGIRMGLSEDEMVDFVRQNIAGMTGSKGADLNTLYWMMKNPYELSDELAGMFESTPTRAQVLQNVLTRPAGETSPFAMRPALRGVRTENPELYQELKRVAQDLVDYGEFGGE